MDYVWSDLQQGCRRHLAGLLLYASTDIFGHKGSIQFGDTVCKAWSCTWRGSRFWPSIHLFHVRSSTKIDENQKFWEYLVTLSPNLQVPLSSQFLHISVLYFLLYSSTNWRLSSGLLNFLRFGQTLHSR